MKYGSGCIVDNSFYALGAASILIYKSDFTCGGRVFRLSCFVHDLVCSTVLKGKLLPNPISYKIS